MQALAALANRERGEVPRYMYFVRVPRKQSPHLKFALGRRAPTRPRASKFTPAPTCTKALPDPGDDVVVISHVTRSMVAL